MVSQSSIDGDTEERKKRTYDMCEIALCKVYVRNDRFFFMIDRRWCKWMQSESVPVEDCAAVGPCSLSILQATLNYQEVECKKSSTVWSTSTADRGNVYLPLQHDASWPYWGECWKHSAFCQMNCQPSSEEKITSESITRRENLANEIKDCDSSSLFFLLALLNRSTECEHASCHVYMSCAVQFHPKKKELKGKGEKITTHERTLHAFA